MMINRITKFGREGCDRKSLPRIYSKHGFTPKPKEVTLFEIFFNFGFLQNLLITNEGASRTLDELVLEIFGFEFFYT